MNVFFFFFLMTKQTDFIGWNVLVSLIATSGLLLGKGILSVWYFMDTAIFCPLKWIWWWYREAVYWFHIDTLIRIQVDTTYTQLYDLGPSFVYKYKRNLWFCKTVIHILDARCAKMLTIILCAVRISLFIKRCRKFE